MNHDASICAMHMQLPSVGWNLVRLAMAFTIGAFLFKRDVLGQPILCHLMSL